MAFGLAEDFPDELIRNAITRHRDEEVLEHMEFQPFKGKPTFDKDNLDNTFTQSKVETVETSEGSWVFDLRNVCILEFRTSDMY